MVATLETRNLPRRSPFFNAGTLRRRSRRGRPRRRFCGPFIIYPTHAHGKSALRGPDRFGVIVLKWLAVESLAAASQLNRALSSELAEIVGAAGGISRPSELAVYECDGWTIAKSAPDLLVLPRTTAHVSLVLAALERRGVAFVPRGAGTGLSGGCLPLNAPVMICTSRMNRILACD